MKTTTLTLSLFIAVAGIAQATPLSEFSGAYKPQLESAVSYTPGNKKNGYVSGGMLYNKAIPKFVPNGRNKTRFFIEPYVDEYFSFFSGGRCKGKPELGNSFLPIMNGRYKVKNNKIYITILGTFEGASFRAVTQIKRVGKTLLIESKLVSSKPVPGRSLVVSEYRLGKPQLYDPVSGTFGRPVTLN